MPSRRQIREAVVQFLVYEAGSTESEQSHVDRDGFWDSVGEMDRVRIIYRTRSALRHIQVLRAPLISQFLELQPVAKKLLYPGEIGKILKFSIDAIVVAERSWEAASQNLVSTVRNDDDATKRHKFESSEDVLLELSELDAALNVQCKSFLTLVESHSAFHDLLKGVVSTITDIQATAAHLRGLTALEQSTNFKELTTPAPDFHYFTATLERRVGRAKKVNTLVERLQRVVPVLVPSDATESLLNAFTALSAREIALEQHLGALEGTTSADDLEEIIDHLEPRINRVFDSDATLIQERSRFLNELEDHPAHNVVLGPFARLVRRLQAISERTQTIRKPGEKAVHKDLERLKMEQNRLAGLRIEADALADAVLREKDRIDQRLAAVVENFAPERIDPVDRAILRLATWEILHAEKVPAPVAIDEAIELAKRFGTTDSGRFVNGVLDKIAKQASAAAER